MDDKLKAELSSLFDKDHERASAVEKARSEKASKEAQLVAEFIRICTDIIEPAMREIGDFARTRGWDYRIVSKEERSEPNGRLDPAEIRIDFFRSGEIPRPAHEQASFSVICDKQDGAAQFHESTMGPGHGGSRGTVAGPIPASVEQMRHGSSDRQVPQSHSQHCGWQPRLSLPPRSAPARRRALAGRGVHFLRCAPPCFATQQASGHRIELGVG